MKDSEIRRYEMFLRVREFGIVNAAKFVVLTVATELFNRLTTVIDGLDGHTRAQASGLRADQEGSTSKASARDEIRSALDAIARAARSMAHTIPGLEDRFRAPRSVSDQVLLSIARAFAADALPLKAEFIKRGLPADFLDELNNHINAFESAVNHRIQSRWAHVTATAGIDDLIDEGARIVRELSPIVQNALAGDPPSLAAWLSATHVESAPKKTETKAQGAGGGAPPSTKS